MTNKIKIHFVSDVVCPWCVIGYKNLEQAIFELELANSVDIEWQPFELNPEMPPEGEHLQEHSARKYGSTPESSTRFRSDMAKRGKEVGFTFNYFDAMKIVNTRDAHLLLEYAKGFNKQTELKLRLFSAFFSEQKDISDRIVLAKELEAVGLDAQEATATLDNHTAITELQDKEVYWHRLGISGVPAVVFNMSTAISGAQPVKAFKQALMDEMHVLHSPSSGA